MILLTCDRLVFGIDQLLEFMSDRAAVESLRPPTPAGGANAIRTVICEDFGDGMAFQIQLYSPLSATSETSSIDPVLRQRLSRFTAPSSGLECEPNDLGIEIIWSFSELPPPEMLVPCGEEPNPELVQFMRTAQSWILGVSICEAFSPWIDPAGNHDLRKVRSVLDEYAQPRLILPKRDAASFREDLIALTALFAAKARCLPSRDEQLPIFFRSYCDRFFGRVRERYSGPRKLDHPVSY